MKLFECRHCRAPVHFDNTVCLSCGHRLGFMPWRSAMTALEPEGERWIDVADRSQRYLMCDNARHDACNWLLAPGDGGKHCAACRHNRTVPDLSVKQNRDNWRKLEAAKRHLFYSLLRWRLPAPDRSQDAEAGLAFDFLADNQLPDGTAEPVLTGHDSGLITINIAEADDAERERRRTAMGEPYRTLIGHFRHEVGHYYWDRLVRDRGHLERCRALFGDDTKDYGEALDRHYRNGPPQNWQDGYISSYATAHPWEDFAETWAHYLHIVDALETAQAFGIRPRAAGSAAAEPAEDFHPYEAAGAAELVEAWVPLTVAINSVNRSMGQPDLYPFVLSPPVVEKLQFMHEIIHEAAPGNR